LIIIILKSAVTKDPGASFFLLETSDNVRQQYRNADFCTSVTHLGTQRATVLQYPSSSLSLFCTPPMDNSNAADKSRIVTLQFSENSLFTGAASTSTLHMLGLAEGQSSSWMSLQPFSDMMHSD